MKNIIFLISIACYLLFTQSCVRYVYSPNMQNVPLFQEKDEVRATIGINDFQAAYAVTNNVGIMLNGQINNSNNDSFIGLEDQTTKRTLFEGGVGYFKPIKKGAVFEVYGGGGVGKVSFDNRTTNNLLDRYSAKSSRLFIQPSIGYTNDFVDVAFSLRFARLNFYDADTSEYQYNSNWFDEEDGDLSILDQDIYTFIEPGITVRGGWKYVKFHMQFVWSFQQNGAPIIYKDRVFNAGVHLNIGDLFQKK